jgi:hypothetical protein
MAAPGGAVIAEIPAIRIVSGQPDVLHSSGKFSPFSSASTKAANAFLGGPA